MKIKDIICESLRNFNLISPGEVTAKARELLEMVELPGDYADRYARDAMDTVRYAEEEMRH